MTNDIPNLTSPAMIAFCCRWKVKELALFGSALRDDFRPDSDLDLLISFESEAHWSLSDVEEMRSELVKPLGREVDLATKFAIERSLTQRRKKSILSTAKVFYAA